MIDQIKNIKHIESKNFFLIAGPCAIESEEMTFKIAEKILDISNRLKIPFIFKGSFKKANRSRIDSFSGIGDKTALEILKNVGEKFKVPATIDDPSILDEIEKALLEIDYPQKK